MSFYVKKYFQGVNYSKVTSSNTFRLEAHAGFFQIAYEGVFWSLCTFGQKVDFLISNVR